MSKAFVERGDFAIDNVVREWGNVNDKAIRNGVLYSSKAPLQSLLGIPIHALHQWFSETSDQKRTATTVLRLGASVLPGLFLSLFLLALARRFRSQSSLSMSVKTAYGLSFALGTMLYPYALTFTGHGLAAATAGCTLLLGQSVTKSPTLPRRRVIFMGFFAALSPFAEYPAALLSLPVLLATAIVWKKKLLSLLWGWALGGTLPFLLGLWAHNKLWGAPFRTGYSFLEIPPTNKCTVLASLELAPRASMPFWALFFRRDRSFLLLAFPRNLPLRTTSNHGSARTALSPSLGHLRTHRRSSPCSLHQRTLRMARRLDAWTSLHHPHRCRPFPLRPSGFGEQKVAPRSAHAWFHLHSCNRFCCRALPPSFRCLSKPAEELCGPRVPLWILELRHWLRTRATRPPREHGSRSSLGRSIAVYREYNLARATKSEILVRIQRLHVLLSSFLRVDRLDPGIRTGRSGAGNSASFWLLGTTQIRSLSPTLWRNRAQNQNQFLSGSRTVPIAA